MSLKKYFTNFKLDIDLSFLFIIFAPYIFGFLSVLSLLVYGGIYIFTVPSSFFLWSALVNLVICFVFMIYEHVVYSPRK